MGWFFFEVGLLGLILNCSVVGKDLFLFGDWCFVIGYLEMIGIFCVLDLVVGCV